MDRPELTIAQMRRGLEMAAAARAHQAAVQELAAQEAAYLDELRVAYGLGSQWVINDWLTGWEKMADGD